jgi:hypothetical protein
VDSHAVELLAAVFLGWAIGAGTQPRAFVRALGGKQTAKLIRLLELLEEPPEKSEESEPEEGAER